VKAGVPGSQGFAAKRKCCNLILWGAGARLDPGDTAETPIGRCLPSRGP
jgi:hypothetical protein